MGKLSRKKFKRINFKLETSRKKDDVKITVIDYSENTFEQRQVQTPEECFIFRDKPTITWINVDGIHKPEIIEKISKHFGLHPLILEDIANVGQRPKIEDLGDYIYIVLNIFSYNPSRGEIDIEQMSIVLGHNFVISFQETVGDIFDPIRERIKGGKGRIRKQGADYLAYSLIDTIVDNYFYIFDEFGERIEFLEEETISDPDEEVLREIYHLKREMIFLRRSVWPLRELARTLERLESNLIQDTTRFYLKDIYDHTVQIIDSIEVYREMLSSMIEIYLSNISNKMNSVMKVLTSITTIFMPLTLITGIYGMNFKSMPALDAAWGYYIIIFIMVSIGVTMVFYFKKRRWI